MITESVFRFGVRAAMLSLLAFMVGGCAFISTYYIDKKGKSHLVDEQTWPPGVQVTIVDGQTVDPGWKKPPDWRKSTDIVFQNPPVDTHLFSPPR